MAMNQVFDGIAANTTSGVFSNTGRDLTLIVLAVGDFGGGTLTVEISGDDGVSFGKMPTVLTATGTIEITIPDESQVRIVLASATAPVLSVWTNIAIPLTP